LAVARLIPNGGDAVTALNPALKQVDQFTPSTWPMDNQRDLDLGSMGAVQVGNFIFANGKLPYRPPDQ
jgi:hypothetical protein